MHQRFKVYFGNKAPALDKEGKSHYNNLVYRGVAKFGIALGSGPRGLGFESRHSDQLKDRPKGRSFLFLYCHDIFRGSIPYAFKNQRIS